MIARRNGRYLPCVLVDLNTQGDFLSTSGACRVHNAETLVPAVRRVIAWAKWHHVPVISSIDSHRLTEAPHDGFPQHCIDGTQGQKKLPCTVFASHVRIEGDNTLAMPVDLFRRYQQVIFRKRTHDLFGNPKADRFLTQLPTEEYILFGVGLEFSIKALALGLLARHKAVTVVADTCGFWNRNEANFALRQMGAKGVSLITVDELLDRRPRRRTRYPHRPGGGRNGTNGNGHLSKMFGGNGQGSVRSR